MSIALNGDGIISGVSSITVGAGASVFSPAANTLALGTNGSERVRVTSSGNIGIGSAIPENKLDVNGTVKSYSGVNKATFKDNQLRTDTSGTFYFDHGTTSQSFTFRTSTSSSLDTTGPSITSAGNLAFPSGQGIDFSSTANSSGTMTSELLSDYEEGTWTPVVGGTATYGTRSGTYTKIGNRVMLTGRINISSIGTGSQNEITGLPFTAAGITANFGGSPAFFTSLAISVVSLTPLVEPGTASIFFNTLTAGATASSNKQNVMQNGTVIDFNITYIAA